MALLFMILLPQIVLSLLPCNAGKPLSLSWKHVGPAGYVDISTTHKMAKGSLASSGAAQAMAPVPSSNGGTSAWLLATANGGVWKTADLLADKVHWTQRLDGQPVACTSISAMQSMGMTVLAGCGGATSSEMGYDWMVSNGGDWGGLLISHDGGDTWSMTAFPAQYYISAIVLTSATSFVVSARAHFHARDDGGVWCSSDGGATWTRTLSRPVYDLVREPKTGTLLAALPWTSDAESVQLSASGGTKADWVNAAFGISWDGRTPFYPTFAIGTGSLFVGALTVNPSMLSDTQSAIFRLDLHAISGATGGSGGTTWWERVAGTPRLDQDGMPKDRMALLSDPGDDGLLYVAGNAGALAWRVHWLNGTWEPLSGSDTADGSAPHVDCRRYFWEPVTSSLLLLSDGGAWRRDQPRVHGRGEWHSLAGDIGSMEFVSAHWDPESKRWVGGAQDNDVVFTIPHANKTDVGIGFIGGDGTLTAVDSDVSPSRLWGAVENDGFTADDNHPGDGRAATTVEEAGDSGSRHGNDAALCNAAAFGFWQGAGFVCVPLLKWFTGGQFSQFVQPWALLSTDRSQLLLYANQDPTAPLPSPSKPSYNRAGIYRIDVKYGLTSAKDIPPPTLELPTSGDVNVMLAGGVTSAGKPDPELLVLLNTTHLIYRSASTAGDAAIAHPLVDDRGHRLRFAPPVVTPWRPNAYGPGKGEFVLGPMSHDRTMSLAISPADSSLLALTGWTSLVSNSAPERVYVTADAGAHFADVTKSLRDATGTIGQWRPSALLLLPMKSKPGTTALLVGTAHGVFASFLSTGAAPSSRPVVRNTEWARLGSCDQLPLVMVAGLSHEPKDDTLLAATMGRGVYAAHGAIRELEALLARESI